MSIITEGLVAFESLKQHDEYQGQSTGKFTLTLTLSEAEAEKAPEGAQRQGEGQGPGEGAAVPSLKEQVYRLSQTKQFVAALQNGMKRFK